MATGLCTFGDNAYLNTPFLATPLFCHFWWYQRLLQFLPLTVAKCIECAFGIWTHRWAILTSPIPVNVSIKKSVALVIALA